jgi:hypothetical protein
MPIGWAAGALVVGSAISANQQNQNASDAAAAQQQGISDAQRASSESAAAASKVLDPLAAQYGPNTTRLNATADQFAKTGQVGTNAQVDALNKPLNVAQFMDPSVAYQLKAGQDAVQSSAAARGGLLSGATLQSLQKTAQGIASTNYDQAVTQAMNDRGQRLNTAADLATRGSTAANIQSSLQGQGVNALGSQANIISQQGSNNAQLSMTSGNVAAASAAAQQNPLGSGISALGGLAGAFFSDIRMKHGIHDISDDEIDELLKGMSEPASYEYTEDAHKKGAPTGMHSGVMAQDLEKTKLGKQMVSETAAGDKQVDIPMAVSTLMATTGVLGRRIKKLEGKKNG